MPHARVTLRDGCLRGVCAARCRREDVGVERLGARIRRWLDDVSFGNAVDGGGRLQPGVQGPPPEISEGVGALPAVAGLRRRVVGAASWTFTGAVFGRAISLVGTIAATRLLSPTAFGQFSAIQLMVTTFAGFAALGLGVAVTKRIAEVRATNPERVGDFARVATKVVLVSGTAATAVVIVGRVWLADTWLRDPALATGLVLASAMTLTSSLFGVQIGILTGFEAFKHAAIANTLRSTLTALLLLVGIQVAGLNGGLLGFVVGEAIAAAWAVLAVSRCGLDRSTSIFRRGHSAPGTLGSLWKVGMPAFVAGVAILLALLVGQRVLAGQPNGYVLVAQFSVAFRWSVVVLFVPTSLSPVMLPFLANLAGARAHDPFRRLLRANFMTLTAATAVPALVLIIARQPVLGLSGAAYQSDTVTFVVMILSTIPVVWNTILSQTALALEAIWAWFVSDLVLALVLISAALLLIPRHGAAGLALAYALGYLATCLALLQPARTRLRTLRSTA